MIIRPFILFFTFVFCVFSTNHLKAQMQGIYTIDSTSQTSGRNFQSFSDFTNALNSQGVSGAVVVNVAVGSGPYFEQVKLEPYSGMSSSNTVTINGNGERVHYNVGSIGDKRVFAFGDSAQHYILDDIYITAVNGFGIGLRDSANYNVIRNCTIEMRSTNNSNNGIPIAFSDCDFWGHSCYTPSSASYNLIENNVIKGQNNKGSDFGIYLRSNNTSGLATNNTIRNNVITGFLETGIYAEGQNNLTISNNDISRPYRSYTGYPTTGIAISGSSTLKNLIIDGNKIHDLQAGEMFRSTEISTGIIIDARFSSNHPARILNNAIYSFNNSKGDLYGIRDYKGRNVRYYNNSISLDDKQAFHTAYTAGIRVEQFGDSIFIQNNIISITRGGEGEKKAIHLLDTNVFLSCNHNNLYVNSDQGNLTLVHFGESYKTLDDWQNSSLQNAGLNTLSVDPYFVSQNDLSPRNSFLNNVGIPVGVSYDLNQNSRDSIPDIGAIEVECMTPSPINFRPLSDTSVQLTTNLDTNFAGSWEIEFDTVNFSPGQGQSSNQIVVTAQLDTLLDRLSFNKKYYAYVRAICPGGDTSLWSHKYEFYTTGVPLAGVYTIDSSQITANRNFQSFVDFAYRLNISGVSDSVLVNVVPGSGPYEQQVIFMSTPGSSAKNYVRINGNQETIQYKPDGNDQRIIGFEKTENFILDSLNVVGLDNEYGFGIHFRRNSNNIKVSNCNIDFSAITVLNFRNAAAIVASHSINSLATTTVNAPTVSNLTLKNNVIAGTANGGPYSAIVLRGKPSSYSINNKIIGNQILSFYSSGIEVYNQDSLIIKGNRITNPNRLSSVTSQNGIYVNGSNSKYIIIESNEIYELTNTSTTSPYWESRGIAIGNINAGKQDSILIFNNLIYNLGDVKSFGLYNNNGKNLNFFNNTIAFIDSSNTKGDAVGIEHLSSIPIKIFNNNINISRGGLFAKIGLRLFTNPSNIKSDFNNFYIDTTSSNSAVVYKSKFFKTLSAWQKMSAQDSSSASVDPLFSNRFKPTNRTLSSAAKNLFLIKDFNGEARDSTPDIGAINLDKFNYPYYPIHIIGSTNQSTGLADSLGVYAQTSGIVVSIDLMGEEGLKFYIVDKSTNRGIEVYSNQSISNYHVNEGDSVLVSGQIKQLYGQTYIEPIDIIVLRENVSLPEPTLLQTMSDTAESTLIRLENLTLLNANDSLNYQLMAVNENNDTIKIWIDADTDVNDSLNIEGFISGDSICSIVGICNQLDSVAPYTDGYRLTPIHFSKIDTISCVITDYHLAQKDTLSFNLSNCNDSAFFKHRIDNLTDSTLNWSLYPPKDSIYENFDHELSLIWKDFVGTKVDTSCGSINGSRALTFSTKQGQRYIESFPLNLKCATEVHFSVLKGGNCSANVSDPKQNLRLQYSTDFGLTWETIKMISSTGNQSITLPAKAKKELIKLRVVQLSSSAPNQEVWVIDDFKIIKSINCNDQLSLLDQSGEIETQNFYNLSGYYRSLALDSGSVSLNVPIYLKDSIHKVNYLTLELNYHENICPDFTTRELRCGGTFQFSNHSLGDSLSYLWEFGDGDSSVAIHPEHFYSKAGIHNVKLTACDSLDCVSVTKQINVIANYGPKEPPCRGAINGRDESSKFLVDYVKIGPDTIAPYQYSHSTGSSKDYTCLTRTHLKVNNTYKIRGSGSAYSPYGKTRYHAWIDYNNDGFYSISERIMRTNNGTSGEAFFTVPDTAVKNTPLRLRMIAYSGTTRNPANFLVDCNSTVPNPYIQRDYTVVITDTLLPPLAIFNDSLLNCGYQVAFTSESEYNPDTYHWDFGDGNTSNSASVIHTYDKPGTYSVKLLVENKFGKDSVTKNVTIQPKVVPIIQGKLIPYCELDFSLQNDSNLMSVKWDFGNGNFATGKNTIQSFENGGEYPLKINTIDSNNCKVEYIDTLKITTLKDVIHACDSFTWVNGITYTSSTDSVTYTFATDPNGCDSILKLDLTINQSYFERDTIISCDQYHWPLNGATYTSSGIYRDTVPTTAGCDSIGVLHLSLLESTSLADTIVACDSYTWSHNNMSYYRSGDYYDTLINAAGCDSIRSLHLTLNSNLTVDSITVFDSLFWSQNNQTYYQSGFYTDTFINRFGCDSIIAIQLKVNSSKAARISINKSTDSLSLKVCNNNSFELDIKNLGTNDTLFWQIEQSNKGLYFDNFENGFKKSLWSIIGSDVSIQDTCGVIYGNASPLFGDYYSRYIRTKSLNTLNADSIFLTYRNNSTCDSASFGNRLTIEATVNGGLTYTVYNSGKIQHVDSTVQVAVALDPNIKHSNVVFNIALIATAPNYNHRNDVTIDNFKVGGDRNSIFNPFIAHQDSGYILPLDSQKVKITIDRYTLAKGWQNSVLKVFSNDSLKPVDSVDVNIFLDGKPCADFSTELKNCKTSVSFTDNSESFPTSWHWDFGDGSTDKIMNPKHFYSTPGTYDVKLISCNQYGCDTISKTINSNWKTVPNDINCSISYLNSNGWGLNKVEFGDINHTSYPDYYKDFSSCQRTKLYKNQVDTLRVGANTQMNVWAWIDYNADGNLDSSELIMQGNNKKNHQSLVNIPNNAIFNVPLRLRVGAGFSSDTLFGCNNPHGAQYRDYTVIIVDSTSKPEALFLSQLNDSCSRSFAFTDTSLGFVNSWLWDFGDGVFSNSQHPVHNYLQGGIYTVKLIVNNQGGSDTLEGVVEVPDGSNLDTIHVSSCNSYLSPGGKTLTTSGVYLDTIPSSSHCDSILQINLTINQVDTTVVQNNNTLTSVEQNASYQWLDCNNSYTAIVNDTNQIFVATANGNYAVQVQKNGCVDTSECYQILTVGERSNKNEVNRINVFPNPTNNFINITFSQLNSRATIELTNVIGELILIKETITKQNRLKIDGVKGVYFLKISMDDEVQTFKVIKIEKE